MSAARYAWMDAALCAQADPDRWTDTGPGSGSRASKRICGHCPVARECDTHASALHVYDGLPMTGVWGGRSQRERNNNLRQMGEAA